MPLLFGVVVVEDHILKVAALRPHPTALFPRPSPSDRTVPGQQDVLMDCVLQQVEGHGGPGGCKDWYG